VLDVVFSLAVRRGQEVLVVLGGEMGSQKPRGGDAQAAGRQSFEDGRKPSRRPSGLDSVVGSVLGELENSRAVLEDRGETLAFVEAACVELGEMRDERRGGLALASGEPNELHRQRVIIDTIESGERHGQ